MTYLLSNSSIASASFGKTLIWPSSSVTRVTPSPSSRAECSNVSRGTSMLITSPSSRTTECVTFGTLTIWKGLREAVTSVVLGGGSVE